MWVIVILMGMLNAGGGIPAGHSEMVEVEGPGKFATKAECEASRQAITDYEMEDVRTRLGAENVIYVSACWAPSQSL